MMIFNAGLGSGVPRCEEPPEFFKKAVGLNYFSTAWLMTYANIVRVVSVLKPSCLICDSGAHAFFSRKLQHASAGAVKSNDVVPEPYTYIERYVRFIDKTRSMVDFYIELDTVELHGKKFQEYQRARLIEAVGIDRLIPVYHPVEDERKFYELLHSGFRYIGIEGINSKRISIATYIRLVQAAYDAGIAIHAFASVKKAFLERVPVYSTDSTTWKSGPRFGISFEYREGALNSLNKKRKTVRSSIRQTHLHRQRFSRYSIAVELSESAAAMQKLAEFYEQYWKERNYSWEKVKQSLMPTKTTILKY